MIIGALLGLAVALLMVFGKKEPAGDNKEFTAVLKLYGGWLIGVFALLVLLANLI